MKKIILGLASIFLIAGNILYAAESEPNDTKGTADPLALNGSNTGAISSGTDVDWWKVITTSDGQLNLTLTVSNGLYCYYQLYDFNGTTLLKSSYTNGTQSYSQDGLSPGTYFIKIYAFTVGQLPAYTISNTLTVAALTIDVEPNALYTQANTLTLNGSGTGHIGFYYNLVRDTTDWWKVTTTGNGSLNLSMSSSNGQYVYYQLYDGNGTTLLKSSYTNGTQSYDVDGLAAGTYYIKIYCFYSDGFAPYTLTTTFTSPPVTNDVEPNNTKAQAKVLSLNNKKTGHVGYYYNGVRDTADWYKVTTVADGMLKLQMTSQNGEYVYYQLFDNDGITSLHSTYTNGTASYNTDGLAAGTYYVRVYCFYNYKWASYTLTDTFFNAPVANDIEPNDTKAQAVSFAVGSTVTGHSGYYYNHQRDTADWYKIVTTKDGQINLTLTSNNGEYVFQTLYDNDGTTVLHSVYTNGTILKSTDGLAAGTYYVRVYCYYNYKWTPYTLTNSLSQYVNNNDGLSNEYAKKGATLPANSATPGHVGFRSNGGAQDLVDWWKINYTGNSDLTVTLNHEPRFCCGGTYTYMQIYKDTNLAPLFSQYNNSGVVTASLTALTQGYYYVKVYTYYANEWVAYSVTPTFTQVNKAKITLQTATPGTDCTNGSLVYKCSKSSKPYKVQLYRYGLPYGAPLIVNNTSAFTIGSLPPGNYYATAYGDGATGNAKGTSVISTIVPVPTSTTTTMITKTKATLNWASLACIKYDSIYYRIQGALTWTKIKTTTNSGTRTLTGLTPSTTYEWQVAHVDTGNLQTATSSYSAIVTFTTLALKVGAEDISDANTVSIYPNPTSAATSIHITNADTHISLRLFDAAGRCLQSESLQSDNGEYLHEINLEGFAAGIYYIRLSSDRMDKTIKLSKE